MQKLIFEWDPHKAKENLKKHRVSFQEASTVFGDPFARIATDHEHSETEPREIITGESVDKRQLVVVFTERADKVRLISARLATKHEKLSYEEFK